MNTTIRMAALGVAATLAMTGAAQAALIDRGGGLIYDTDLNVTWLADANYAQTSSYDADGMMNWLQAVTWADNLTYFDAVRNVTYDDWRLPTTTDMGMPGCDWGIDCGNNFNPASSEMAHLYFVELGNLGTLANVGPFTNFQSNIYWSGTEYEPDFGEAWAFDTAGAQYDVHKSIVLYALAVRSGDVATVPEAETYALMLAGLGLIGWRARRRG